MKYLLLALLISFIKAEHEEITLVSIDSADLPSVGDILVPDPVESVLGYSENITMVPSDDPFRDLRRHDDSDFINSVIGTNQYVEGTSINLSTHRASLLYDGMMAEMQASGLSSVKRFILHKIDLTDQHDSSQFNSLDWNNQLVEEWDLSTTENGSPLLTARIHTKNVNDPNNPVSVEEMKFVCSYYAKAEDYFCHPEQCDFKPSPLAATPAQKCVKHFTQAAQLDRTVFLAAEKQREPTGSDTYRWIVECFLKKIETIEITGTEFCYYEGFAPENTVSLESMQNELNSHGFYYDSSLNLFQKQTIVEHHRIEVDVNTTEQQITNVLNEIVHEDTTHEHDETTP